MLIGLVAYSLGTGFPDLAGNFPDLQKMGIPCIFLFFVPGSRFHMFPILGYTFPQFWCFSHVPREHIGLVVQLIIWMKINWFQAQNIQFIFSTGMPYNILTTVYMFRPLTITSLSLALSRWNQNLKKWTINRLFSGNTVCGTGSVW